MRRVEITDPQELQKVIGDRPRVGDLDPLRIRGRDPRIYGRAAIEGLPPLRTHRKRPRQLEHCEQVELFKWRERNLDRLPDLEMMYAIPNAGAGGQRGQAGKMKAEGVMAGVPDINLDVPRDGYHGLRIELKVAGRRPSPEQRAWIERYNRRGYRAIVCVGWEAARDEIESYLRHPAEERTE
jgi:hypothetical protein